MSYLPDGLRGFHFVKDDEHYVVVYRPRCGMILFRLDGEWRRWLAWRAGLLTPLVVDDDFVAGISGIDTNKRDVAKIALSSFFHNKVSDLPATFVFDAVDYQRAARGL